MFPHNALTRDDIRRRESQIGPHDEVPSPSHLSRPPPIMRGQAMVKVIREGHEEDDREHTGENPSDRHPLDRQASNVEPGTVQERTSLPSIHSLFGIAGTGGGIDPKTNSVSDVAQRAGTSASSLMDIFPSPFSEHRNPPEEFPSPPFSNISRLPRLHRQSSTSLYASSSSARDSLSSCVSLVTPTTNLTLDSRADDLERRESYATFAEEVERRRMSDNLPLGRRVMTLSQADEALRIRMGRNESYPSSAGRQNKHGGKMAPSLTIESPDISPFGRSGFAFATSRPSTSSSGLAFERGAPANSSLGIMSHASSPTPEPTPALSANKRPSAETIGPRKRFRSSSPAVPSCDESSLGLASSSIYSSHARRLPPDPGTVGPGLHRPVADYPKRIPLLNRSESVPHLRQMVKSAQEASGPVDDGQVLADRPSQEMRPHTVQSATYKDFSSRIGSYGAPVLSDGLWLGAHVSNVPGSDGHSPRARRRLSLEGVLPGQDSRLPSAHFTSPYASHGPIHHHQGVNYNPGNTIYPPYNISHPFPYYQATGPLFGAGSGLVDSSSGRRASLSASNLEATVALGIPHGVVLTQLPDASTKDRLGNPTVGPRYGCDFCGKTFSRPSSLKIHIYTHTGEKPYVCTWPNCNRQFSVQSNLKRHAKVHYEQAGANGQEINLNNESPEMEGEYAMHPSGSMEGSVAG